MKLLLGALLMGATGMPTIVPFSLKVFSTLMRKLVITITCHLGKRRLEKWVCDEVCIGSLIEKF